MKMFWFYGFLAIGLTFLGISTANPDDACVLPDPILVYPLKVAADGQESVNLSSLNTATNKREKLLIYKVVLNDVEHILHLKLNEELAGEGITMLVDGVASIQSPEMIDLKEYTGVDLKAAFTIDEGLHGYFALSGDMVFLLPDRTNEYANQHKAYFGSEIECNGQMSCGDDLFPAADLGAKIVEEVQLGDGENINSDGSTAGRRKRDINAKVKLMSLHYVVTRALFQNQFNFNVNAVIASVLQLTNGVDSLYQDLNVRAFTNTLSVSHTDLVPINGSDAVSTLHGMVSYTVQQIVNGVSFWGLSDHVVFLTDGTFIQDGGVVGVAYLKTMCTHRSVSYSGFSLSSVDQLIRPLVVTHEIGHSFGLFHNTEECDCGAPSCIMDTFITVPLATKWSNCSRAEFDILIHGKVGQCLLDELLPRNFRCGNNFLEPGEECDCGSVEECTSLCCEPTTCRLREFAECDDNVFNGCCDSATCRFAPAGTMCRPPCVGDGGCDLPEYCTGFSAICPFDSVVEDGTLCNGGNDRCKSGYCLTKDRQCSLIHGPDATSASLECYLGLGTNGTMFGNCGVNQTGGYIPCAEQDVECGKLYCDRVGLGSVSHEGQVYFINSTYTGDCYFVVEPPRPGYMDDSTYIQDSSGCNANAGTCNGGVCTDHVTNCGACPASDGICSSLGFCFCTNGLAPPLCDAPGPSGSLISGPVPLSNPDVGFCTGTPSDKWTSLTVLDAELNIEVTCANKIVISFDLCPFLVRGYALEDLVIFPIGAEYDPLVNYTISSGCVAVPELAVFGLPWRARIELNSTECGGLPVHTATENGFLNQFRTIRDGVATGIAVRVRPQFVFNYTCKWTNKLNGTTSIQPDKNVAMGNELVRTNYTAALSWYHDSSFTQPIDNYIVKVGERIYAQLDLQAENANLWLKVRDCWVSKYSGRLLGELRYSIISGGCPAHDVLGNAEANQIIEDCSSKQSRFSFLALAWTEEEWDEQNLFLHCNVAVCDSSLNSCACPACPAPMRKKRNVESENVKVVSVGPLRLK